MIGIELLVTEVAGLQRGDVQRWIDNDWIRPRDDSGEYLFMDIDVARVRLIRELRDELDIDEAALPVVLMLLDQLHDLRRRMRELGEAIERTAPAHIREGLARHLAQLKAE
jgi:chaperone modulatory protein CbpM